MICFASLVGGKSTEQGLTMQPRLASNSACLQTIEITGLCHHTRQNLDPWFSNIYSVVLSELLFGMRTQTCWKNLKIRQQGPGRWLSGKGACCQVQQPWVQSQDPCGRREPIIQVDYVHTRKNNVINFFKIIQPSTKPTHRITWLLIKLSDFYYSILKDKAKKTNHWVTVSF